MTNKFQRLVELSKAMPKDESIRCKHVSFLLFKGKIVSIGQNAQKTHPIHLINRKLNQNGEDFSDRKPHCSEWSCIRQFCKTTDIPIQKCTLVNVRVSADGTLRNAKPCPSCAKLLLAISPKSVYFSVEGDKFEKFVV